MNKLHVEHSSLSSELQWHFCLGSVQAILIPYEDLTRVKRVVLPDEFSTNHETNLILSEQGWVDHLLLNGNL